MANWAQIDQNNRVVNVVFKENDGIDDGYLSLLDEFGGTWIQTSYTSIAGCRTYPGGGEGFRKNFAQLGYTYDATRNAFIPPKTFDTWVLNEDTCHWDPPYQHPADGKSYFWDDKENLWKEVIK